MKTKVTSENLEDDGNKEGYTVFLCFEYNDELSTDEWISLPYPFSCCGCYDGHQFFSHLLALLLMCQLIQREEQRGATKSDFEGFLPEPPHFAQGEPVAIKNAFRRDALA